MPASANFVALCQTQLNLLVDGLGAAASAVYLAEETATGQDMELTPVASYPADALQTLRSHRESLFTPQLPDVTNQSLPSYRYLADPERIDQFTQGNSKSAPESKTSYYRSQPHAEQSDARPRNAASFTDAFEATVEATVEADSRSLPLINQVVIPLIHDELVMGILVAARPEQTWSTSEKKQLNHIADTLAIACIMDRQEHWMQDYTHVQYQREIQQHEVAHDFLHQFRNPLTAIRTFGKLLLRRMQVDDANHSVAEGIVRESDHLKDLFEEFRQVVDDDHEAWLAQNLPQYGQTSALPAASAEFVTAEPELNSRNLSPEHEPRSHSSPHLLPPSPSRLHPSLCSLMGVIDPLLVTGSAIAQDQNLDFWTELPDTDPVVWADAKALREILGNILDNALKYSTQDAAILIQIPPLSAILSMAVQPAAINPITAQLQQQQQAILIADTGPGIPVSDLKHVFERHYRGVQTQTDTPGTGLGLAIAHELIDQMQGTIQVYSPLSTCPIQSQRFHQLAALTTLEHPGTVFIVWLSTTEPPNAD